MSANDTEATGNCFQAAFDIVLFSRANSFGGISMYDVHLCHGIVYSGIHEQWILHAWVEIDDMYVLDESGGNKMSVSAFVLPEYYGLGKIDPNNVIKYTRREAIEECYKSGHYGNWEKELDSKMAQLNT